MNSRTLLALLCLVAAAALIPERASAIDYVFSGSAQLDYHFVPFLGADPRPASHTIDGFTEELSIKLAVDVTDHISGNIKVCWGCHGFELAMGFADFRVADELNIRVGRFNPTFGEFQLRYDVANHRTSDRPLPYDMGRMLYLRQWNRSVLPLPYVETGVEVSGSHFFGNTVQLDYAAHAVAGLRSTADRPYDVDFIASRTAAPYYVDNNSIPSVGGRVGLTVRLADRIDVSLGASGIYGPYDNAGRYSYMILGADGFLRLGRTNIRGEYLLRRTEMAAGVQGRFEDPLPVGADGTLPTSLFAIKEGWYLELEQPINRLVELVARWDGLHRVGEVAPGSELDFDAGIMRGTLGANFSIARNYRVKASGEYWYFWGLRGFRDQAVSFHLSAVAVF